MLIVEDFDTATGITLPDGSYDTVAGFVLHRLQRIPELGDGIVFFDEHIRPKLPREIPTPAVFEVLGATTATTLVGGAARTAKHAVGVLGEAAGGVWSWTRSKLGELTHRPDKADAGPEVEPGSTATPDSEASPATGGTAGKAAAKPTPAAPAQSTPPGVPPARGGATGKAQAKAKSAPSTADAGGTSA
ncbi:transporter associated domain-containing protein [Rhodococcus sp. T2V]|uniref:transporter associated domain-containing protein n=1 Tax=Rhodococcus sp. T2V TaxID=3034164 RepID=UPI0023E2BCAB|nr:transporter associated domain-containing protein [Rhodococcus sp. T2V]MDF3312306.1 transporter associated domain-containing protein [Rhodococcus sp. T2V]